MPRLEIAQLVKRYGSVTAVSGLDLSIADGEFVSLLGPSGCGKTTALNCVAGLEIPDEGRISLDSRVLFDSAQKISLPAEARGLGMVFQSYALWPHMSVASNLEFPLKLRGIDAVRRRKMAADWLDRLGIGELGRRYPHELSGGQQQRVALARAIVYKPPLLLLDEPLSNLDAKVREQTRVWLKSIQSELGTTTLYVTHDQDEAMSMSDRIAVMSGGDVVQFDSPETVYREPASSFVAGFVGSSAFLRGRVDQPLANGCILVRLDGIGRPLRLRATKGAWSAGQQVWVCVRPENVRLNGPSEAHRDATEAAAEGPGDYLQVVSRAYRGSSYRYGLALDDQILFADAAERYDTDGVNVSFDEGGCVVFPSDDANLAALNVGFRESGKAGGKTLVNPVVNV